MVINFIFMPIGVFPPPPSTLFGTPHEVWVDFGATQAIVTGSQAQPFKTLAAAITYADALAVSEPGTGVCINVKATPPATVIPDFTMPNNITVTIRGDVQDFPTLGDIDVAIGAGEFCNFNLNNIAVGAINITETGTGSCLITSDLSNIGSINQSVVDLSTVTVQVGGNVSPSENSSWQPRSTVGTVQINSSGLFEANCAQLQGDILAGTVTINDSQIEADVFGFQQDGVIINRTKFSASVSVGFQDASGVVKMDAFSWNSFRTSGSSLDGTFANTLGIDNDLYLKVSFTGGTPAANEPNYGIIYAWNGSDTVDKAIATSTQKIAGVYVGNTDGILTVTGRLVPVRLETGLTLSINDPIYVSEADIGYGTNIKPTLRHFCGYVVNFGTYTAIGGGYVWVLWDPQGEETQNVEQVLISSLNPSGVWFSGEYVGPTSGSTSQASAYGIAGTGFAQITKNGILKNFRWTNADTPGSSVSIELYQAPNGNPLLLAATGIIITMIAGDYIANLSDQITVFEDDIIVFYNITGFGYSPRGTMITADLIS